MSQRVLITAGATGIGRATALAFAARGDRVHVCDVDEDALATFAVAQPGIGTTLCDVADEAHAGDPVAVTIQMLAADAKRMHIFQTATREADGVVVATGEQMLLHVDTKAGRACPTEGEMQDRLLRIAAAQAALPQPPEVGRHVGAKRA